MPIRCLDGDGGGDVSVLGGHGEAFESAEAGCIVHGGPVGGIGMRGTRGGGS